MGRGTTSGELGGRLSVVVTRVPVLVVVVADVFRFADGRDLKFLFCLAVLALLFMKFMQGDGGC